MKPTNILRLQTISIICTLLVTFNACRDGERNEDPPYDPNSTSTTNRDGERNEDPPYDPNSTNTTARVPGVNSQGERITRTGESYSNISEVKICDQTWTRKNLDVITYRNGDTIAHVTKQSDWGNISYGAWCYYNYDPATEPIYGKLYNWFAVNDPRGLGPTGWHVPTHLEWAYLESCLGGNADAGRKLKEVGTIHWKNPNYANDSTHFTAVPGGQNDGNFRYLGETGKYWARDAEGFPGVPPYNSLWAYSFTLEYNVAYSRNQHSPKDYGLSVRLIRDKN